jgi:type IV secretion system protein VirD4
VPSNRDGSLPSGLDPYALSIVLANSLGRIYLGGVSNGGWALAEREHSVLVLGPPRSGKTSSLIIPNVLLFPGAVISTSTKPEVMKWTLLGRQELARQRGEIDARTCLYDPSGTVDAPPGVERVGWSPVNAAKDWGRAGVVAEAMVLAKWPAGNNQEQNFWSGRAGALLATTLHAAALQNEPMSTVLRWINNTQGKAKEALTILADVPDAAEVLMGIITADERTRSGIFATAAEILSPYTFPGPRASTEGNFLDAKDFCDGQNTLYICATGQQQKKLAPMVVGMLSDIRDAVYQRAANREDYPPVLMALDELTNIAPIHDFPAMLSEAGGQGLIILGCMQDLSQASGIWGQREADGLLTLFNNTLLLPGIKDIRLLEMVSKLSGNHDVRTNAVSRGVGPGGKTVSNNVSVIREPLLSESAISRGLGHGKAIVLNSESELRSVERTPYYNNFPWSGVTFNLANVLERSGPTGGGWER